MTDFFKYNLKITHCHLDLLIQLLRKHFTGVFPAFGEGYHIGLEAKELFRATFDHCVEVKAFLPIS